VLRHHLAHADPHSGNLRFRLSAAGPRIGVLDLGAVQELPGSVVDALHRLIHAAALGGGRESATDLVERFAELGFQRELLWPMRTVLPDVVQALTLPFRAFGPFAAGTWRLSERLEAALGEHRWNFRAAGSPALLPVIRALSGTAQYLAALRVPVDWRDGYTALALPAPAPGARGKPDGAEDQTGGSTALRVRVCVDGQVKVLLSFPADAAGRLDELLPDEVRQRLAARGIGAGALGERAAAGGLAPGCLFELSEQGREMRVWLE
jgi:hypothetical protein